MTAATAAPGASIGPRPLGAWTTVWTRGEGCEELARSLAHGDPVRVEGDLRAACIAARAEVLVTTKLTSFDLLRTVVPYDVDLAGAGAVVAAVGSGPHSVLAARVAARLAEHLEVEGSLISVSPNAEHDAGAHRALERISAEVPGIPYTVVREPNARALVNDLPPDALLVVGAPGGSWLQRQFFGPGHQLVVAARTGAVVVRDAPLRCFHRVDAPAALGAGLLVADALLLAVHPVTAVVDDGALVGIVRSSALASAAPGDTVESIMEDAVFLHIDDPIEAAGDLTDFLDGAPIPVVDGGGRLVGSLTPPG